MPFQIVRNDITNIKADAIVNFVNSMPVYSRGADAAIYQKAGAKSLLSQREKIGERKVGEAEITSAFGLKARFIIHTVGPCWQGGDCGEAEDIRRCYCNSLRLAGDHGCESIAIPLISTGAYGLLKELSLKIALSVISGFLEEKEMLVYLVVFDREPFGLSEKLFSDIDAYIEETYVADMLSEELLPYSAYHGFDKQNASAVSPMMIPDSPSPEEFLADTVLASDAPAPAVPRTALPMRKNQADVSLRVPLEKEKKRGRKQSLFSGRNKRKAEERSLDDVVMQLGETFQERLFGLIDEKGLGDVEVYKKANLDRKLFSKIRCNVDYRPRKTTALALAVALELNLDETKDLLARAEMALSPSSKFDLIITYFIEREIYDIYTINLALFQHDQPMLG